MTPRSLCRYRQQVLLHFNKEGIRLFLQLCTFFLFFCQTRTRTWELSCVFSVLDFHASFRTAPQLYQAPFASLLFEPFHTVVTRIRPPVSLTFAWFSARSTASTINALLKPLSRFGDKPLKFQLVRPQIGTVFLKGLSQY